MTVYEHKSYCSAMPDVHFSDASCVCLKKYGTNADFVADVKALIFPIELDDVVWAMLSKHVENQINDLTVTQGAVVTVTLVRAMLAQEAKKYAAVSTPMQTMTVFSSSNGSVAYEPVNPKPILMMKSPLGLEPVEGNLTYEPARPSRKPLFKTPPPPDGYQIERKSRASDLWTKVTTLAGMRKGPYGISRYFRRRLPHFYRRRSSAEKMMTRLYEQNSTPGFVYRVSPWWIYDGDRAAAKEIEAWRNSCGGCDTCTPCQGTLCPCACHKHIHATSHPDGTVSLHCSSCGQLNGHTDGSFCIGSGSKEWYD